MTNKEKNIVIKTEGLGFEYTADEGKVSALSSVDLEIERGSFTAIIGRNGSGKSTLAKTINALLIPTEGNVIVGATTRGKKNTSGRYGGWRAWSSRTRTTSL